MDMLLSGSQILIECLKEQGVDTVFGIPGGTVLNLYDELFKHQHEIRHILTSHEQGAAHAADGYARTTGKVGVCIATSGPGATNLVTGIAAAYMDSVPVIAITGNVGINFLGKDSFQEVDIAGITMPITKHNFIVKDIKELANTVRRAFKIASEGRPGPVLIDLVKDVTESDNKVEFVPITKENHKSELVVPEDKIKKAIRIIKKSKKPVVLLGGGAVISKANEEIKEFVYKIDAPVCDTLMGKGAFDATESLYLGMTGMHGTSVANKAIEECDLLIAAGVRFSDRITGNSSKFAKECNIIHIDIDPAEINKNTISDVSIVGDISFIFSEINKRIESYSHDKWNKYIREFKDNNSLIYDKDRLTAPFIIEKINELAREDAIIVTDVGQHQMWTAQFYKFTKFNKFLTSGGLGAMGYGLGAAIGASVGQPNRQVINISGDGCFRMNMNELATASRYNISVINIIMNNNSLGMVRQWQSMFYGKRYSQTEIIDNVDYVKVAEALGAKAFRITNVEDVQNILLEAMKVKGPVVIDCLISKEDMVLPMVTTSVTGQDKVNIEH